MDIRLLDDDHCYMKNTLIKIIYNFFNVKVLLSNIEKLLYLRENLLKHPKNLAILFTKYNTFFHILLKK